MGKKKKDFVKEKKYLKKTGSVKVNCFSFFRV